MTLITYLTRVHFADGILEEALWSELEAANKKRAVILFDEEDGQSIIEDRVLTGLPASLESIRFTNSSAIPSETVAHEIASSYRENNCDVLIAAGSKGTIELGKAVRIAIAHKNVNLDRFSYANGGSRRIGENLADFIAIPGIAGIGASASAHTPIILTSGERALLMCRKLIPTINICDPTLTSGASPTISASAGVEAITLCVEAFLSRSYNPPAEGIALDGLNRALVNLRKVVDEREDISARREMMAAGLNGSLALQKGLGASNAISNALEAVSGHPLDHGTLNRIALPAVLAFNKSECIEKYNSLLEKFTLGGRSDFVDAITGFFARLPLPSAFHELKITKAELKDAARLASRELATGTNPRDIGTDEYLSIMQSAY